MTDHSKMKTNISAIAEWLRRVGLDVKIAILFCTRLPLSHSTAIEGPDLARASWAMPVAGAIVGGIGALVYVIFYKLGLSSLTAAALALAATLLTTGCMHEDGLADTADGFGGAQEPDRKLAIMRDSRIGTYGACALAVSIMLRWSALADIADPRPVALALIAAHAAARGALPSFMRLVPLARADGLAVGAAGVSWENGSIAAVLGVLALAVAFGPLRAAAAFVLLLIAAFAMARLCLNQVGGQTGDAIGALEQINEMLILITAAIVFAA
ncbi:MAG: adenosylcobinamide-GDP ribazoletransferase [Xanthobacteraceae bacterium]|jgi:adenosylcobinamide-GDP ribazoletransferase